MTDQTSDITWRDHRTPVSTRFDDPYFSLSDGLAEARHVFLTGNNIPARFAPGFHIAELGFGTGLNMLAAWQAYRDSGLPGRLHFSSFEAFPLKLPVMEQALSGFPELGALKEEFLAVWPGSENKITLTGLDLTLIPGDARTTLPNWDGVADAWFLDGFSPAKNPELWEPELMRELARHTSPGGTIATYTAAGHVRRALADAGFCIERTAGYGQKRHMTVGTLGAPT